MDTSCSINALTGASVCGTGGWTGAQPGDPETSNLLLKATPAFGGVDVEWTFPSINANAVAYTIIYRSLLPNAATMTVLKYAQGNFYYDAITSAVPPKYYYWIRVVSIYGTEGELIGPASATAKGRIAQVIEDLTGKIDAGVLAQSLKKEIDRIELNALGITQEMIDRAKNDDALGVRINEVSAFSGSTRALLQEEVLARVDANEAFVSTVETVYATLNGNIAGVQNQVTAVVNDLGALASDTTKIESQWGKNLAQIQQTMQTNIKTNGDTITDIGALWTVRMNVNGLASGFGIYNNGETAEAGFDVDRFWIGRTNANKRKPFIIEDDIVYIDEAAINYLTFSKLRDESGSFIVENGKVKAAYIQADMLEVEWAKIKNVKVVNADIDTAAVSTLKIQGNAVTVPVFADAYDQVTYTSFTSVLAVTVSMPIAGWLYASCTGYVSYNNPGGFGETSSSLTIDGTIVSTGGGLEAWVNTAHSGALYVDAGLHVVRLMFESPSGKGRINFRSMFAMGVKR